MPGWLLGVVAVVVLGIVGVAAYFVYAAFMKPATPTGIAATPAPAASVSATLPPASPIAPDARPSTDANGNAAVAGAQPASPPSAAAPSQVAEAPAGAASAQALAGEPPTAASTPAVAEAPAQPVAAPVEQKAAPPPVDHSLKIASDLVARGEKAYARGDYRAAIRHANSALDVRHGYASAERLLHKATDAQQQALAAEQRAQAQRADELARQQAAAAAAARPTPDELYNQRAHSECARGLFGKSCRHKVREQVCAGVSLTAPGTTVCKELKD